MIRLTVGTYFFTVPEMIGIPPGLDIAEGATYALSFRNDFYGITVYATAQRRGVWLYTNEEFTIVGTLALLAAGSYTLH